MNYAIDYESSFENAVTDVMRFLPKLVLFLVILIVGIIVAKIIAKIVAKVLEKVGFDKAVERGGIKQALARSKYDASDIVGKLVYYTIFLLVLSMAFGVFGPDNPISQFMADVIRYLPKAVVAVVIIVLAAAIAAAVKELLGSMLGGLSIGSTVANIASIGILAFGAFAALNQLEIAPEIVNGLFYALLALAFIPPIIAFGVGGIDPARDAIRNAIDKSQEKAQEARAELEEKKAAEKAPAATAARRTSTRRATTSTSRSRS